jgi:hypothetical protein
VQVETIVVAACTIALRVVLALVVARTIALWAFARAPRVACSTRSQAVETALLSSPPGRDPDAGAPSLAFRVRLASGESRARSGIVPVVDAAARRRNPNAVSEGETIMATQNNGTIIVDDCNTRIAGVKKYIDPNADIPVDGKLVKPADFIAVFQADIDAHNGVDTLQAQVKSSIASRKTKDADRRVYDKALKAYVANRFGADSTEAHAFGYPPPKAKKKTAETKAAAAKKAEATRAARHTMGSKQKVQLKGTAVVDVTPDQAAALAAGDATAAVVLVPAAPEKSGEAAAPTVATTPAPAGTAAPPAAATNGASHS